VGEKEEDEEKKNNRKQRTGQREREVKHETCSDLSVLLYVQFMGKMG
jgi:hypothetical protein